MPQSLPLLADSPVDLHDNRELADDRRTAVPPTADFVKQAMVKSLIKEAVAKTHCTQSNILSHERIAAYAHNDTCENPQGASLAKVPKMKTLLNDSLTSEALPVNEKNNHSLEVATDLRVLANSTSSMLHTGKQPDECLIVIFRWENMMRSYTFSIACERHR